MGSSERESDEVPRTGAFPVSSSGSSLSFDREVISSCILSQEWQNVRDCFHDLLP
jgi:hypothetical protein